MIIAQLEIRKADSMTEKGRRDIARWLRAQAKALVDEGHEYDPKFKARYLVNP